MENEAQSHQLDSCLEAEDSNKVGLGLLLRKQQTGRRSLLGSCTNQFTIPQQAIMSKQ